jgi:hypothetical protein
VIFRAKPNIRERGQTILLVAVSLVAILGLAALAIDVITLYVARNETQRAVDAGALAGAKTIADAGVTTDPCNAALALNAQTLAIQQATAVTQQNKIAGQPAQTINVTFPNSGSSNCPNSFGIDPQVTVFAQRTGLPTFFARVWNQHLASVGATATAEAYNPSNSGALSAASNVIPIAPRCVKPMVLPNCDLRHGSGCTGSGNTFVNTTTGAITFPGQWPTGVIGETLTLTAACSGFASPCVPTGPTPSSYYPLGLSTSALHLCPSCSTSSGGFQQDLECCNSSTFACGQQVATDYSVNPNHPGGAAANGGQCLIHEQGNTGQDLIDTTTQSPILFIAGLNDPFVGASIQAGDHILTSDSVVTIPLYDGLTVPASGGSVTVIGYLQVFITSVDNQGDISATVLNVSGCGTAPSGSPVQGSISSVPVRLIQAP